MQYPGYLDMDMYAGQDSNMAPRLPPSSGHTLPWSLGRNGE